MNIVERGKKLPKVVWIVGAGIIVGMLVLKSRSGSSATLPTSTGTTATGTATDPTAGGGGSGTTGQQVISADQLAAIMAAQQASQNTFFSNLLGSLNKTAPPTGVTPTPGLPIKTPTIPGAKSLPVTPFPGTTGGPISTIVRATTLIANGPTPKAPTPAVTAGMTPIVNAATGFTTGFTSGVPSVPAKAPNTSVIEGKLKAATPKVTLPTKATPKPVLPGHEAGPAQTLPKVPAIASVKRSATTPIAALRTGSKL